MSSERPLKIHVTGVYGLIGNLVYRQLMAQDGKYDVYGSGRRVMSSARAEASNTQRLPDDHFMIADVSDAAAVEQAMAGMDAVLHIAAVPDPSNSFDEVLSSNIQGTHNVLEACRKTGIKRLVYASSIMTNWGYFTFDEPYKAIREGRYTEVPADFHRLSHMDLTYPTEPYSASKVWAEGYCRTYHDKHDISIVCLRIGWVNREDSPFIREYDSVWCSNADISSAFHLALDATSTPRYDICYVASESQYRWVDLDNAKKVMGFVPESRAEDQRTSTSRRK